jgi:hypothetical protein
MSTSAKPVKWSHVVALMTGAGGILLLAIAELIAGGRSSAKTVGHARALSPLHEVCAFPGCYKPATHAREYRIHGTGMPAEGRPVTYYFCDDHWPAPSSPPWPGGFELKAGKREATFGIVFGTVAIAAGYGFVWLLVFTCHTSPRLAQDVSMQRGSLRAAQFTLGCSVILWLLFHFGQ